MKIKRIILDLDGVLADFNQAVHNMYPVPGFDPAVDVTGWNLQIDAVRCHYGISDTQFWNSLDTHFWANIPLTPEADDVICLVEETGIDAVICTSPSFGGCDGKQKWISKFLPGFFMDKRYLIGPAKDACADPHTLLIDDSETSCEAFRKAGGLTCLFPRPWNSNAHLDPVGYLRWVVTEGGAL